MKNTYFRCFVFILVLPLLLSGCNQKIKDIPAETLESRKDYLGIIWVPEDYTYSDNEHHFFSFRITDLSDKTISGKYVFGYADEIAYPECYYWDWVPYPDLGEFNGIVIGKSAECTFEKKRWEDNWDRGTVVMDLGESNMINTEIHFNETAYPYEKESTDGCFIYRPYNISDFSDAIDSSKTIYIPVELDYWGAVRITLIWIDSNKPYNRAFITDMDDNILYTFPALTSGIEYTNIIVEDLNGDGLKDVCLFPDESSFPNDLETVTFKWLQMENGLFYSSDLIPEN